MAYYKNFEHFVNSVFTLIRRHSRNGGANYKLDLLVQKEQLTQIWNDFDPNAFTWELKHRQILAYASEVDEWMLIQNINEQINKKRDKIMQKPIKTKKDER